MGEETEKQKLQSRAENKVDEEKFDESKPEPKPEPKPSEKGRVSAFRVVGLLWLALTSAAWAGTIWKVMPEIISWFGKTLGDAGRVPITASSVAGVAAGLILFIVLQKKYRADLELAKPGQGTWTRVFCYVFLGLMALFAAYSFYRVPLNNSDVVFWKNLGEVLWEKEIFGKRFGIKSITFPSAAIFLTAMLVVHLLLSRPKWTDFLIETQGELFKVSWPPKKEWVGSSFVVLLLTLMTSVFLYLVDEILRKVMPKLGLGF